MRMHECPRFESCSAPACPLWKSIQEQAMLRGESACFYLLEFQKQDSAVIFKGAEYEWLYPHMTQATQEIFTNPDQRRFLIRALEKSAKSGSRILAGRKLNA